MMFIIIERAVEMDRCCKIYGRQISERTDLGRYATFFLCMLDGYYLKAAREIKLEVKPVP